MFGFAVNATIQNIGVEIEDSRGGVKGGYYTGGLVGKNNGSVSSSYAIGTVSGTNSVGGLVGGNSGTVNYSYALGAVSGTNDLGGLVGYNYDRSTISNSYAMGTVNGASTESLVGINSGTIQLSYYNTKVTSVHGVTTTVSEDVIKQQTTFVGFNFDAIWEIEEGLSAPTLAWQNSTNVFNFATIASIATQNWTGNFIIPDPVVTLFDETLVKDLHYTVNYDNNVNTGTATATIVGAGIYGDKGSKTATFNIVNVSCSESLFASGEGTQANPYKISNATQLASLQNCLRTPYNDQAKYYTLTQDIDLADYLSESGAGYSTGQGWLPIGNSSTPFYGHFDGAWHKVTGLWINRPTTDYVGLFGHISGTTKNIGVKIDDSRGGVKGGYYTGGLVGNNSGSVSYSYVWGAVSGTSSVGGLMGYNFLGTISNSYATGAVSGTGDHAAGGLVGCNFSGTVSNSYATGTVNGTISENLVGINSGTIQLSYYNTKVTNANGVTTTVSENAIKQKSTFVDFNFDADWEMDDGVSTPTLAWQNPAKEFAFANISTITNRNWTGNFITPNPVVTLFGKTLVKYLHYTVSYGNNVNNGTATTTIIGAGIYEGKGGKTASFNIVAVACNETLFSGGAGTQANPYKISNATQLASLQNCLDSLNNNQNKYYILTQDIDLADYLSESGAGYSTGQGWLPIGNSSTPFYGHFDGAWHKVTGLWINRPTTDYVGLFGHISGTTKNIGVKIDDSRGGVKGGYYTGGLVGNNSGSVSYSYVWGAVSGTSSVGGLMGYNFLGTISNSYATGAVSGTGDHAAGGLVGCNFSGTVSNSYATGTVNGTISENLVGINSGTIQLSYYNTKVTNANGVTTTVSENAIKQKSTFVDFNFDADWEMDDGVSTPTLAWQNPAKVLAFAIIITIPDQTFTGNFITPNPIVTLNGEELEKETHYTVVYSNNENIGTATVTIVGVGDYLGKGSKTASFNIVAVACNETLFAGGIGTQANPYKISNATQLTSLKNCLDSDFPNNNQNNYYVLTQDIDLTDYLSESGAGYNAGQGWLPIGNSSTPFYGHFDGAGYKVIGLWINRTTGYVGLFGYTDSATIQNIGVEIDDSKGGVKGASHVGSLVGYNAGTVSNSYATGAVSGTIIVGGLVGYNSSGIVSNSYATGTMNGANTGYLVGSNNGIVLLSYYNIKVTDANGVTTAVSENAIKQKSTFVDFNFDADWEMDDGVSSPTLAWQNPAKEFAFASIDPIPNQNWTDNFIEPNLVVTLFGKTLVKGIHYIVSYGNNVNSGTATTTIVGAGIYEGKGGKTASFNIVTVAVACNETLFAGGAGTQANPYKISNATQLASLKNCFRTPYNDQNNYYVLTQDIDLTDYLSESGAGYSAGQGWLPIGGGNYPFYWHFDGAGHKVTNLWINRPTANCVGLFGCTYNATIQNIGVELDNANGGVKGGKHVGGLVGYNSSGTVSNSYATGAVSGTEDVGGLVGYNSSGIVSNSYATGTVNGAISENLVGRNSGSIQLSYYNTKVTDANGVTTTVSENAIKQKSTFVGFNFDADWEMDDGVSAPILAWQNTAKEFALANISTITNRNFTGNFITPNPMVTLNDTTLVKGIHYTVKYQNNVNVGAASVTIVGAGIYEGKGGKTESFNIVKSTCNTTLFTAGSGTKPDPYQISNAAQFASLRNCTGIIADSAKYYILTQDIDLTDYLSESSAGYNAGQGWLPIGDNGGGGRFYGHFDGAGHKVIGLWINSPYINVGLFGYIYGATIQNIGVEIDDSKAGVKGYPYVGGLVGYNYRSTVSNSYATGAVSGTEYVGGLVGGNYNGIVESSYATGAVTGAYDIGGLVGYNYNGTVSNSYAMGTASGTGNYVGGLVGYNNHYSTVSNSYAMGAVSGIGNYVDNLVGYNHYSSTVSNSYYGTQTTDKMREQATFVGFNFDAIWKIDEGLSYPYFAWQPTISNPDLVTVSQLGNINYTGLAHTPELTVEYNDITLVENVDYTITYINNTNAGTASVIVTGIGKYGGAVLRNFIIEKIPLTVTVGDKNRIYGETNTELIIHYDGFVNGENESSLIIAPVANTLATVTSTVAKYKVSVSGGVSNNYDFTYVNGTLTITKAPLTVTADSKSKTYGEANPDFISYEGFVNGEDERNLDTPPIASTLATTASTVGEYEVTVSGGVSNNYEFTYVNGTLTVTKATPTNITHPALTATYTATNILADIAKNLEPYFSWVTPSTKLKPTQSSYAAIYNRDSANYEDINMNITVIVTPPAVPIFIVPYPTQPLVATEGDALSSVLGLPTGWEWLNPTETARLDKANYTAIFIPSDLAKYDYSAVEGWNYKMQRIEYNFAVEVSVAVPILAGSKSIAQFVVRTVPNGIVIDNTPTDAKIGVYDTHGRVVGARSARPNNNGVTIPVHASGMYFVKIQNGSKVHTQGVVVR
ncbi:hypothetical protein AGMMS49938_11380 [Fibrobacterales bacterium]|nr:hypothetical protein AGMMS49938_11380 [Fibrobacterales bacterium]